MDSSPGLAIFRKDLFLRMKLQETGRFLSKCEGKVCLDAGFDNGIASTLLRKHGGAWQTVVRKPETRNAVAAVLGESAVVAFDGARLPFEDKSFDIVVVSDFLEYLSSEHELIAECHRILKPTGRLVLNVPHIRRWSIVNAVERILGPTPEKKARARKGYTEADLFQLLKHGFDVHTVRSYSHTFVQAVRHIIELKGAKTGGQEAALQKLYSSFYLLYWLAFQFDALFVFTKGHYLVADAMRHPWRPRETPILNDGRSISEVVLSKIRK